MANAMIGFMMLALMGTGLVVAFMKRCEWFKLCDDDPAKAGAKAQGEWLDKIKRENPNVIPVVASKYKSANKPVEIAVKAFEQRAQPKPGITGSAYASSRFSRISI